MMLSAAMAAPAMTATTVLAQQQDTGGQGEDFGKSSPVGLLLMIVFLIAVVFLVRSMTKHLKRLPASFDSEENKGSEGKGSETAESGAGGSGSNDSGNDDAAESDADAAGESSAQRATVSATSSDKPEREGS